MRTDDSVDELAGVTFVDGLRWLEAPSEEVRSWDDAQNATTTSYLRRWGHREETHRLVDRLFVPRFWGMPRYAGGRWFRKRLDPLGDHACLEMGPTLSGPWQVLVDADQLSTERPANVEWFSPSPDGRMLAYGLAFEGVERNRIALLDLETGKELPDAPSHVINDGLTGGVIWQPDSSGFFFTARVDTEGEFRNALFWHRIGMLPPSGPEPIDLPEGLDSYVIAQVSGDGGVVVATSGLFQPRPRAICRLDGFGGWEPFVSDVDASVIGELVDDEYIAATDHGAGRSRLVAIPVSSRTPNEPATWREIVPESDAVLRSVRSVGDLLYLTELVDAHSRVRVITRDGTPVDEVPLPGVGTVAEPVLPLMRAIPGGHPTEFLFAFATLVSSRGLYRHDRSTGKTEELEGPAVDLPELQVTSRLAVSKDGTRVPYQVVSRSGAAGTTPRPALLHGYGGFGVPWLPQFNGALVAFALSGGLYVHTHLRGGGDFGREWWENGRFTMKQNGYDDLYAIAEDLVARGETAPSMLAVTGGSGGGLMSGVAVTQRPELWRVVVPQKPFLDLIGGCREPYGRDIVAGEFGDIDDPDDVARMATFSPCQLIHDGVPYPAVYIDAGATDARAPAWHARKFAARLQAATSSGHPVVLRIWHDVGHGWSNGRQETVAQMTDWLSFVLSELGMRPAN